MALPGCHGSPGRTSSLQTQESRTGGEEDGLSGGPLGRGLPVKPVSLLEFDPVLPVMLPPIYLLIWSRVVTCGPKGCANHR